MKRIKEPRLNRLMKNTSYVLDDFENCRCSRIPELEQEVERLKERIKMLVDDKYRAIERADKHFREVKRLSGTLKEIQPIIDNLLGDTDDIPEDWTDEDIKNEEPLIWVHIQIIKALEQNGGGE